ncbi:MAG: neutral/alkaline non-lysosomal ceramidase N-terminal domain-containing protein [Chthonomonadales bacterium]
MKRNLLAVVVFALCSLQVAHADLLAGAARTSITPDQKLFQYQLGGYVAKERTGHNSTGVHDTCYARALVLANGSTRVAIVSLDLCFMPANVKTAVLQRIGASKVPADCVFLSATHTHSAPDPLALHSGNTGKAGDLSTFNPKLLDWMADQIGAAINEAASKLQPAKAGSAQRGGIGLNRNRRGEKITDDEMTALRIVDATNKPIACMVNYAAHPVYFGANMMEVSGDWSGSFARVLEAKEPGSVALFLNGAEGDASANGSDDGMPAEKIVTFATKLGQAATSLLNSITPESDVAISGWTHTVQLPPRKPHPFFLLAGAAMRATPAQVKELVDHSMPTTCELSFVRIGNLTLMGFPGEPTAPVGLAAKAMARDAGIKNPAVVALTNGWLGYLVTAEQYKAGKYEPTMSFYGETIGATMLEGVKVGILKSK